MERRALGVAIALALRRRHRDRPRRRAAHAVGASRPAGHVDERDVDTAATPGRARRQGVLHGGRARAVRGATPRRDERGPPAQARRRRLLQRRLLRARLGRRKNRPHLARHRAARRPDPGADTGGSSRRRATHRLHGRAPGRPSVGSLAHGALHHVRRDGADASRTVQQQLPHLPNARSRRDPRRDEPRAARRSARRHDRTRRRPLRSGSATRAAVSRATRSSSRRATSSSTSRAASASAG